MSRLLDRIFRLNIYAKMALATVSLILIGLFFSFRILDVPTGLTVDEAAFGYNAVLLSRTLHDQNGRFLPVFVLSIDGKDWRQPLTQYYLTGFFKIFGPSVFNLRFSSVVIMLLCTILTFILASQLLNSKIALISAGLFLTTPIVMIQTHMALDNIMTVPFTLLWLINLYLFNKNGRLKYLVFAAISLGVGFYSYKGMRATIPVWTILTIFYLSWEYLANHSKANFRAFFVKSLVFSVTILPFFAIIPLLESKYPGAVFDRQQPAFDSLYSFLYPYFSSYDLSFLFIRGDELIFHSTFRHGMMLLTTLPLFILGLYQASKQGKFWWVIILAFFTAPLLYGYVDSVHRASRLMTLIPSFVLICSLAAKYLIDHLNLRHLKVISLILSVLMLINFLDFVSYYWYVYPNESRFAFGDLNKYQGFEALHDVANRSGRTPYVSSGIMGSDSESAKFYESVYFSQKLPLFEGNQTPPTESFIVLTESEKLADLKLLDIKLPFYHLLSN